MCRQFAILLLLAVQSTITLSASAQTVYEPGIVPPELVGGAWLNTPKNEPIKLTSRKGKVTVVEFWTFG